MLIKQRDTSYGKVIDVEQSRVSLEELASGAEGTITAELRQRIDNLSNKVAFVTVSGGGFSGAYEDLVGKPIPAGMTISENDGRIVISILE